PGRAWLADTGVETSHCATDQCGSDTPPARQAIIVSPEQSQRSGPAAAHSYGLPSCAIAKAMAARAPADVACEPDHGAPPPPAPPPPPVRAAAARARASAAARRCAAAR